MSYLYSKLYVLLFFTCASMGLYSQSKSITYESNGKTTILEEETPFQNSLENGRLKMMTGLKTGEIKQNKLRFQNIIRFLQELILKIV